MTEEQMEKIDQPRMPSKDVVKMHNEKMRRETKKSDKSKSYEKKAKPKGRLYKKKKQRKSR